MHVTGKMIVWRSCSTFVEVPEPHRAIGVRHQLPDMVGVHGGSPPEQYDSHSTLRVRVHTLCPSVFLSFRVLSLRVCLAQHHVFIAGESAVRSLVDF